MTDPTAAGRAQAHLRLFGLPRLTRDGTFVELPPGIPSSILALLVLNGGAMDRDSLCERIWPDACADMSRHQLRTVLARLRAATGLTIERQADMVVLAEPVWCDVEEFILSASRAVASVDPIDLRNRLALHAQRLWTGTPLEMWRHEDWAMEVRARAFGLQRRLWALLDDPPAVTVSPSADPWPLPPLLPDGREDLSAYRR